MRFSRILQREQTTHSQDAGELRQCQNWIGGNGALPEIVLERELAFPDPEAQ